MREEDHSHRACGAAATLLLQQVQDESLLAPAPRAGECCVRSKDAAVLRRILNKVQSGKCAYCDGAPSYGLDIEHLVPVSRGGSDDITNLIGACGACNSSKADLTALEYLLWKAGRERVYVEGFGLAEIIPPRPNRAAAGSLRSPAGTPNRLARARRGDALYQSLLSLRRTA